MCEELACDVMLVEDRVYSMQVIHLMDGGNFAWWLLYFFVSCVSS